MGRFKYWCYLWSIIVIELKTSVNSQALIDEIGFINNLIACQFKERAQPWAIINVGVKEFNDPNKLGEYKFLEGIIHLNNAQNFCTLYHEISHAIDFELFKRNKLSRTKFAWKIWRSTRFQLKYLSKALKCTFSSNAKLSAYCYYVYSEESVTNFQKKMHKRLGGLTNEYWRMEEEVFARTMEVWFYSENLKQRNKSSFSPAFFAQFPREIVLVTSDCTEFIDKYIKNFVKTKKCRKNNGKGEIIL